MRSGWRASSARRRFSPRSIIPTSRPFTGSEDADTLEVLAVLVEAYENEHIAILPPDPIDAILFSMEQRGMARADLQEVLGVSRGRLSEVLSGKRSLSKAMIYRLVDQLDIPAEILIQPASLAQP